MPGLKSWPGLKQPHSKKTKFPKKRTGVWGGPYININKALGGKEDNLGKKTKGHQKGKGEEKLCFYPEGAKKKKPGWLIWGGARLL